MELSAFEFFSELALQKVVEHQGLQRPFETPAQYYALLEFEQPDDAAMEQAMALFEHCVEQGWVLDGVVSQSVAQAQTLWRLREDISETISRWTPYKNDISTLISRVPDFSRRWKRWSTPTTRILRLSGSAISGTAMCTSIC